jgi:hypothetical protein
MPADDRRSLLLFYALAYGITWALWIPALAYSMATGTALPSFDKGFGAWSGLTGSAFVMSVLFQLAVYGPALAALALSLTRARRGALAAWRSSLVKFGVAAKWYLFVLAAPLALAAAVIGVNFAIGGSIDASGLPTIGSFALLVASQLLTSGFEEPGWRGFALPLLQRTHSAENASWYLGLAWAGWHLPFVLYLYREMPTWQLPLMVAGFTMNIVAMGYVHAWIYNSTGSVAMNALLHGWANAVAAVLASVAIGPMVPYAIAGVSWLFVAWLLRRYGKETLRSAPR